MSRQSPWIATVRNESARWSSAASTSGRPLVGSIPANGFSLKSLHLSPSSACFKKAGVVQRICSIDPGQNTFATVYDPIRNMSFKWGEGDLHRMILQGDDAQITRMVRALHAKFSVWLSMNYDIILLPDIRSHWIKGPQKRGIVSWEHEEFRKLLRGVPGYVPVREDHSTIVCSTCGFIGKKFHTGEFNCYACGMKADRDVNAAKNIFLRWVADHRSMYGTV